MSSKNSILFQGLNSFDDLILTHADYLIESIVSTLQSGSENSRNYICPLLLSSLLKKISKPKIFIPMLKNTIFHFLTCLDIIGNTTINQNKIKISHSCLIVLRDVVDCIVRGQKIDPEMQKFEGLCLHK